MTTAATATRTAYTIAGERINARRELDGSRRMSTDPEYDAMFRARCTPEAYEKLIADTVTYEAGLEARIAALTAEYETAMETACHRCEGTGQYGAPTSVGYRNGVPACFTCKGTGLNAAARRARRK